ncbi:sulfhydryl oxidase, partial [Elysia marginata]
MAYHFRKLKNTLRLLPSTKTMGFSTRLNEGDSQTLLPAYPEDSSVAPQQGLSDLMSRSLKQAVYPDISRMSTNNDCVTGITRSHSDQFLPALISKTGNALSLPATCNDLAQILRLPIPLSSNEDSTSDVRSVFRIVYPTSDDIFVEISQGLSDFVPSNTSFKDFFRYNLPSPGIDNTTESTSGSTTLQPNNAASKSWSPQMPAMASSTLSHLEANCSVVKMYSSNPGHASYLPSSCNLFSSSSSSQAEPSSLSSINNNGSQQGKSSGKDGPSPEQMHKIKEKLEKAVCKLFSGRQDYSILHKNIVLENNLFGDNKKSVGMLAYGIEILKLRLRIHARFSNTSVELQSVTMLEQNGVIRIHWRLRGLSQIQTLKFWRLFQSKRTISKDDYEWLEAFSYFHIGKDGLVHKHRIDR